jgi:hypothetical protein
MQRDKGSAAHGSLGPGWAYFVEPLALHHELQRVESSRAPTAQATEVCRVCPLFEHVLIFTVPQSNACESTFAAIERANAGALRGYAVTGVVACIDSRHGLLLPNAIADLQKGERCVDIILSGTNANAY